MNVKINNQIFSVKAGQTILELAASQGIKIPSLCYHPDLEVKANCRICVVEVKGEEKLAAACSTPLREGMEIYTDSPKVKAARALNLELIFAEHTKKCADCLALYDCELLRLAKEYGVVANRFPERKKRRQTKRFGSAVEIDNSQCIDCQNCLSACQAQGINHLELTGRGIDQEVSGSKNKDQACVYCGQCTLHCPVSSIQEQIAWPAVEKALKDKNKIVVAQYAPAVRVSIGEEFGLPAGTNCEKQLAAALKKAGFNFVADIDFGADITTLVEADELLERFKSKKAVWPMMTSCCPAWVAFVESSLPELMPNLTTARSPHIYSAQAIKTHWARQQGIDPKKLLVVSIVPCTAKKQEAARRENRLKKNPLVDYVLTTRELAYLLKRKRIDLKNLAINPAGPEDKNSLIFNNGSGAAVIYGASGGVMESALRTASFLAAKNKKSKIIDKRLEYKDVRGLDGFKEASVELAGRKLKVGIINGLGNFQRVLPKLSKYHYIEVMACPGGCIGGGGQPIPTTETIRKSRMAGLYAIDKKRTIRRAHENQAAQDYLRSARINKLI